MDDSQFTDPTRGNYQETGVGTEADDIYYQVFGKPGRDVEFGDDQQGFVDRFCMTPAWKLASHNLVFTTPNELFKDARRRMDRGRTDAALVVDDIFEPGEVKGIVTARNSVGALRRRIANGGTSLPVRDIMSTPVQSIDQEWKVMHVLKRMEMLGVHHLPVMVNDKPIGIVRSDEVVRYLQKFLFALAATKKGVMQAIAHEMLETPIQQIMQQHRCFCTRDLPLNEVLSRCDNHNTGCCIVVDTETTLRPVQVITPWVLRIGLKMKLPMDAAEWPTAGDVLNNSAEDGDVVTVKPETTMRQVLCLMEVERLHHIPVIGDDGKVIGLSTRDALISYMLYDADFSGTIWTAPEDPNANGSSEG